MAFKGGQLLVSLFLYTIVEVITLSEEVLDAVRIMPPSLAIAPHLSLFLRKTTIFTFPPAFILCLIHGVVAELAVPALGLIPMFFSALLGAFLMYRNQITFSGSPITLTRANVLLADVTLGLFLLFLLILSWAIVPDGGWRNGSEVMLGTYATVPLMINCGIHLWFFVSNGVCFLAFHEGCVNCRQSTYTQGETAPAMGDVESSERDDVEAQTARSEDFVRLP